VLPHRRAGSSSEPRWEPFSVHWCGRRWTPVDPKAFGRSPYGCSAPPEARSVWTPLDTHRQGLEIYGSGGWVFESPRARR
jgi:hypothetical protein